MKIFFLSLILFTLSFGDATIEVIKKVDSLPSLAMEDASVSYDDTFRLRFFKALVADMNVISIFNVDRHHNIANYNDVNVLVQNKDMNYVLRYKLFEDDDGELNVVLKLISNEDEVFTKSYKIKSKKVYMFLSHAIAYDINSFMGMPSVEWMKRKVIFSRLLSPKKSEIVIADYTLSYQSAVIKGGLNLFPKWADKQQSKFYYTSFDSKKPTLKFADIRSGSVKSVISSDGMIVCSDVSDNGSKLLLTMAPKGQPDIYLYNVGARSYSRITKFSGIDVNAQFMDNNNIVFVSNRLGYPNIFSKNLVNGAVEQMVYYGRSNSACSARGNYVVYKARESSSEFSRNTFNLHLISTKTDFIRRLTATGVNEFPRFSKDGDAILFIKNYKAQSSLGIIRLNHNKNYLFPLKSGRIQSMDW